MDAYIHFLHLPTGSEEGGRIGFVLIILQAILLEQATRDGRLGVDGIFGVVEQTTVEKC